MSHVERLEPRLFMAASIDRITPDNGISPSDGLTNTGAIALVGRASPGERVRVFRDGVGEVGAATASANGSWSFDTTALGLLPGTHRFAALGTHGGMSAPVAVSIDILAPAAPTIVAHAVGGVTQVGIPRGSRLPTISILGACETSPRIRLNLDGQATTAIASPDAFGSWSIQISAGDGLHSFTAVAMDAAGNLSEATSPFQVYFDTVDPLAPQITSVSPQTSPGRVATSQFTLHGTAEPSSVVQVFVGGQAVGVAPVNASGAWSFNATPLNLGGGVHTFSAMAWDGVGNSSGSSNPFPVTVDTAGPAAPAITSLLRESSTAGFNFVVSGRAEPGSLVSIQQVGAGIVGQVAAGASGQWTFTHRGAQLAEGSFSYTATARDSAGRVSAPSASELYQPNIVLVNLDDMRADELRYMPFVSQHLAGAGTLFSNSFAPTSLSGPSRASLLSGLYAHNTGVLGNAAPSGGAVNREDGFTLPAWLQGEGYRTGLFGKHETLRDHMPSSPALTIPPGWDEFSSRLSGGLYFDMTMNINGREVEFGSHADDYSTDVWARQGVDFINSTNQRGDQPLFMYFAPLAGHFPYTPAPRHAGAYGSVDVAHPPSFNVAPQGFAPLTPAELATAAGQLRPHLESLLSVDDAVARFYATLSAAGELDNTVFVFTADNGYMWGEHAVLNDKNYLYEESIRVPLVVFDGRAPGGRVNSTLAANIDLAPTIADLAGAAVPYAPDGISLRRAIHDPSVSVRNDLLIESWWMPPMWRQVEAFGHWGAGVRTQQWKYNEFASGRTELFDLANDPFELNNLSTSPGHAAIRQQLSARLNELRPSDRAGPTVSELDLWHTLDSEGNATLKLFGVADDAGRGGSQLGSPEYFIDHVRNFFTGKPADTVDGGFNASREGFVAEIPASELAKLRPGTHRLWVRARDVYGNFGEAASISFVVGAAPRMLAQTDTGVVGDGLTLVDTLKWAASTPAGYTLRGFAVNEWGDTIRLDASGSEVVTFSATLPQGKYQVFTIAEAPGRDPIVSAAANAQVVGMIARTGMLHIFGTNGDDQILVTDQATANRIAIYFSGVLAGTYMPRSKVAVHGRDGNDVINAVGRFDAFLSGDNGDDILIGGDGNDHLDGGRGDNNLHGNGGDDTYYVRRLFPLPSEKDPVLSVDRIWEWAGNGDDELAFMDLAGSVLPGSEPLALGEFRGPSGRFTRRVSYGHGAAQSVESIDRDRRSRQTQNQTRESDDPTDVLLALAADETSLDTSNDQLD